MSHSIKFMVLLVAGAVVYAWFPEVLIGFIWGTVADSLVFGAPKEPQANRSNS